MSYYNRINENYGDFPMPSFQDLSSNSLVGENGLKFKWLYRVFKERDLPNIKRFCYDREYTASQCGNLYGAGVYCTTNLSDTIKNSRNTGYGDSIMKMKVIGGFSKFIILVKNLAVEEYGDNWSFDKQIRLLMGKNADTIIDATVQMYNTIDKINDVIDGGQSSNIALMITRAFGDYLKSNGIRGVIFHGNTDGTVAIPFDFSSVIPYAVLRKEMPSEKLYWKKIFGKKTYDRFSKSIDTEFRYGNKYKENFKTTGNSGLAKVMNDEHKFNYIDTQTDEPVLPRWVDMATSFDNDGFAEITYNNITKYIVYKKEGDDIIKGIIPDNEKNTDFVFSFRKFDKIFGINSNNQKSMALSTESKSYNRLSKKKLIKESLKNTINRKKRL